MACSICGQKGIYRVNDGREFCVNHRDEAKMAQFKTMLNRDAHAGEVERMIRNTEVRYWRRKEAAEFKGQCIICGRPRRPGYKRCSVCVKEKVYGGFRKLEKSTFQ